MKTKTLNVVKNEDGLLYLTFPNIHGTDCVAAFTTRMGGVSRGQYAAMNMSFTGGDDPKAVRQNYNILFESLGLDPERAVLSHQTHTKNIKTVTADDIGKGIVKDRDYDNIDGLITNIEGVALVTQYADCVPLVFYDKAKRVVATSHAGWRGTVQEIGKETVLKMAAEFGSNQSDIMVGIGPSIGSCCYEVDDPVYNEFKKLSYLNLDEIFIKKQNGKYMLNLWLANRRILENAGIDPKNICVTDLCTCCNSHIFHSHRATGGNRGNLAAIIALK